MRSWSESCLISPSSCSNVSRSTAHPYLKIVCDLQFESAISKIQHHQTFKEPLKLSTSEAKCVAHLKIPDHSNISEMSTSAAEEDNADYDEMTLLLQSIKRPKVESCSRYIDCRFIRPTSNLCERFFSVSKAALSDCRKTLTPENLEMQLFLKCNRHLWDFDFSIPNKSINCLQIDQ